METVYVSLGTSLAAAIVFWLFFNYIPERKRYAQVRTIVEFDIFEITMQLLFFVQMALQTNKYGNFYPQYRISAGLVSIDEFRLWLQNKCLNDTYKFDEMGKRFLSIGDKLDEISYKIVEKIDKCSTYYTYMTSEEILILRKIGSTVRMYNYTDNADHNLDGVILRPLIPNLSYMAECFKNANDLLCELQEITWSYKNIDSSINKYIAGNMSFRKASILYYQGKYPKCISTLKKSRENAESSGILSMCLYKLGKLDNAYTKLDEYLSKTTLKPISLRGTLAEMYSDPKVQNILSKYYSNVEVAEMAHALDREKSILNAGLKEAKDIEQFYIRKNEESSKLAAARMKQKYCEIEASMNKKGKAKQSDTLSENN